MQLSRKKSDLCQNDFGDLDTGKLYELDDLDFNYNTD